jgi:DNA repair protein SbcC/Rad50
MLSAIELALTGEILAMQRADPNYRAHLVHRGAENSRIILDGAGLSTSPTTRHENVIGAGGIDGGALLSGDVGRFYSERCYLAQASLGQLLEIYQSASPREESALTRFVKELLRLDVLDALIDGLYPAGDVRNTRRLSPAYMDAETKNQDIDRRVAETRDKLTQLLNSARERRTAIHVILSNLSQLSDSALGTDLPQDIDLLLKRDDDEQRLIVLSGYRRDLVSVRQRALPLSDAPGSHDEATAVVEEQEARDAADTWRATIGRPIEILIGELREVFPDLPSVASTDPNTAFRTALERLEGELQRCSRAIVDDDAVGEQIEKLNQDVEKSRARIALADEQLASITGDVEGLSRALASIIPHIHSDNCPVCGRDYHEVSSDPLVQRVSTQVARLAGQADRLQGLGRSRANSVSEQSKAERERDAAIGKRLGQEMRGALKARVSQLTEAKRRLNDIAVSVGAGSSAIRREAETQRRLSEIRKRDRLASELRASLGEFCNVLKQPAPDTSETVSAVIERLEGYVAAQEAIANDRLKRRREASSQFSVLHEQETDAKRLEKVLESAAALKKQWQDAFAIAEHRRQTAKTLARSAADARAAIVGRIFNSSLNKIWRDLFVRLAPTEPYVPAFRIPQSSVDPVTAQLETVHREGGSGGAPGSMLSAGNLNTAALTLFLALHLSVKPQLPWLILDDPVQSMDEVHIAQFAALLRTLSKEHHRQLIIAVHERPLFDYLTLELSPAFAGDQLITVELSRSSVGASIAEPTYHNWEPDKAIVAA